MDGFANIQKSTIFFRIERQPQRSPWSGEKNYKKKYVDVIMQSLSYMPTFYYLTIFHNFRAITVVYNEA